MPQPYQEEPEDEFDYETDWKEAMDLSQPGGGGHATASEQEEVLVGLIPFNKVRSARRYFLGYSYTDNSDDGSSGSGGTGGYSLHREAPAVHPVNPNLRAFSFSSQGFVPESNEENDNGEPYIQSPFEGANGEELYYAGYQLALVTVRYKSWGRVLFLPDSDISGYQDEWRRWTQFSTEPSLELLQADGVANLIYAEGPGSETDPKTPFPVPLPTPLGKTKLIITWYQVPHEYVSIDPDLLDPVQFTQCLGKVNSTTFIEKYAAGTVAMLEAPVFTPTLYPVSSNDPNDYPLSGYDIRITLSIFDPPKGSSGSDYQGHNLLPWRPDGLFYYCTRDGSSGGTPLLLTTDFNLMFQNANVPPE